MMQAYVNFHARTYMYLGIVHWLRQLLLTIVYVYKGNIVTFYNQCFIASNYCTYDRE